MSRWDRSYARAQAAYDAREAPCEDTCPECQGGGCVDCEACDGQGGTLYGPCSDCRGGGIVPCDCQAGRDWATSPHYDMREERDMDDDINF